jgi:hypothetical protein
VQKGQRRKRSLEDLKRMVMTLLSPHDTRH